MLPLTDSYRVSVRCNPTTRCGNMPSDIRRVIEGRFVPLPKNWNNFLALSENKSDLSRFVSREIIEQGIPHTEVVVSGGFDDESEVQSTNTLTDVTMLKVAHEEADTRIVLHAVHSPCETVVVSVRDTDVFLMLVYHFNKMRCKNLWMMAGTSKSFEENWRTRAEDISIIQRLRQTTGLNGLQEFLPVLERNSLALASEHERSQKFWEALMTLLEKYKHLEESKNKLASDVSKMMESLRTKEAELHKLHEGISVRDTRISRLEMALEQQEKVSYDGTLIVEIPNYSQKKAAAMTGTPSFYSDDFYTDRHGYRMCARVYLYGDGVGKGSHLSIFFAIKKGRYDNYLPWPFQRRVTFTLLNQAGKDHLSDAFRPDPTSSSFQKPVKEMNIASGCPMFVAHKVIENLGEGFLRNNTISLRVKVDPPVAK